MEVLATAPKPSLTLKDMVAIVDELARVKSRQDVEAALAIYHPDAVLLSPALDSRAEGSEQLRKNLETFFRFAPDYGVALSGQAVDADTLCAWGEISFTPAYTFRGDPLSGARAKTPVFILFRFRDRMIAWESFHFDLADVARQAGVPAESFQRA